MERKRSAGKNLIIVILFLSLSTFTAMSGYANETESIELRETLKEVIILGLFSKMEQDVDKHQQGINAIGDFLSEDSKVMLNELISVAKLDISPEEKNDKVIEIAQTNCGTYGSVWISALLLREFLPWDYWLRYPILADIIAFLEDVGVFGSLLCLLGLV